MDERIHGSGRSIESSGSVRANTGVARLRSFARVLDSAFRVPGTRWRFGLDPILGLVPGVGDVVGGSMALYLLWVAARAGAPAPVLTRMALNIGVDTLFGAIPLLGDLLDAGWKANNRNLRILEEFLEQPDRTRSRSKALLVGLLLLLVVLLVGVFWLAFAIARALVGLVF